MGCWHNVNDKPKIFKFVSVYCPLHKNVFEAYWDGQVWMLVDSCKVLDDETLGSPTYWTELPPSPEDEDGEISENPIKGELKDTGIVRRIDDLGRIVIPREICRKLLIHEGDAFSLFCDKKGVYFKKKTNEPLKEDLQMFSDDVATSEEITANNKQAITELLKVVSTLLEGEKQ